ncbi:hypothetical protein [Micromonospora sp. WMMD812]|uniref:hypothetical protein n=1 Tax=Micromonospora sp. WMMD812 TaxID=3015152 RepID=UPI00248D3087|nr:hypothetical protein [Micromonospora sp. WMMD812]WBB65477.1 hypothetical protein O7603_19980 [Micromonospora sp. WMMD812]
MQRSRFVFLAAPTPAHQPGGPADRIVWMLVSPNNRPLGRGAVYHDIYARCRESVLDLQANVDRIVALEGTVPASGHWSWRIELDDMAVALSSRSYLRARECTYNLERFLEALPLAEVVPGTRDVRRDRRRAPEPPPPSGGTLGGQPYRPARLMYESPARRDLRQRDAG